MVYAGGRTFEAFKELNNSPSGLGSATVAGVVPEHVLRAASRATGTHGAGPAVSPDGETWTNTGNATNLNGLTNPKIGMYATASTAAGTQAEHGALRLLHARRAAVAERRVRRHVAEPVPLEPDRAARAGRVLGRGRQADAAGRPRRLLRRRPEQQPQHDPAAGAVRPVDDDDADDVQPERELRAGRAARVRGRRQLRQGRPRPRGRPGGRVPARGRRRGERLRRAPSRCPATSRPRSSCGSSPTARR